MEFIYPIPMQYMQARGILIERADSWKYLWQSFKNHVDHSSILIVFPSVRFFGHLLSLSLSFGLDGKGLSLPFHLQERLMH